MAEITVNFAENTLTLLAEKAIWWADESALMLSDVHLGKGGIFRRHGVAIPAGHTAADLNQIGALVDRFGAERLLILGDLIHGPPDDALIQAVRDWRLNYPTLEITLIAGNHDRHLPVIPAAWTLHSVVELNLANLRLGHEPAEPLDRPEIVGHIHPAIRMRAGRNDSLRAPVFWMQPQRMVLPAFGSFTGGYTISPDCRDRVFAIGPDQIVEIPPIRAVNSV